MPAPSARGWRRAPRRPSSPCPSRRGSAASRTRRQPDLLGARRPRARDDDARLHQIGAALDHERHARVARRDLVGEAPRSTARSGRRCRRRTRCDRARPRLQAADLFGDGCRRALRVAPPEHRLRAPVAAERAAARGDHVPREAAVGAAPRAAVALDVDQVPRRQRQRVEIGGLPRRAACRRAHRRPPRSARPGMAASGGIGRLAPGLGERRKA